MWTVYKTLCDFCELHKKLKSKYTRTNAQDGDSKTIEVPPLLPLGLFYLSQFWSTSKSLSVSDKSFVEIRFVYDFRLPYKNRNA